MIVDAGHEIGAHGYLHENPIAMTPTQEEEVLVKSIELIEKLTGKKPRGYVAPWWEMSDSTAALLQKYGFSTTTARATATSSPSTPASATPGTRSTTPSRPRTGCSRSSTGRRSTSSRSAPTGTSTTCRR